MKRGSSIDAPHAVQIATGCDGQPTLPSLREALEREPKYRRHIERAGRSGPRCGGFRTWGQAAPVAERGNLKAPEVTQLNYRPTAKVRKAKACDTPRPRGEKRRLTHDGSGDRRQAVVRRSRSASLSPISVDKKRVE